MGVVNRTLIKAEKLVPNIEEINMFSVYNHPTPEKMDKVFITISDRVTYELPCDELMFALNAVMTANRVGLSNNTQPVKQAGG